jgi:aerobic carbon-monoxide dehydrogenase large subunit
MPDGEIGRSLRRLEDQRFLTGAGRHVDLLRLPVAAFRFIQADTRTVKTGNGHGGARSMHMGGAALYQAAQTVVAKGRALAAHLLQAEAGSPKASGRRSPSTRSTRRGRGSC